MNIKAPLAAILLMTASAAFANPAAPAPPPALSLGSGVYNMPTGTSLLSPYSKALPDDASFNCSTMYNLHIPYDFCTPEQELARLSFLGICPFGNKACFDYFERIMRPTDRPNPVDLTASKEGVNGQCLNPPCLTEAAAPAPAEIAAAGAGTESGAPGFIGPPVPPGFYDKQDKKALVEARKSIGKNGVKDVIDLGNGSLAKMRDDGTVEMCGRSSCEKPVPAENVKNPKIEQWVANNNAGFVGENGGFGPKSVPNGPPAGARKGAPANPDPSVPAPEDNPRVAANGMGEDFGRETNALGGPGGPGSRGGGSSGSGGSGGFGGSGGYGAQTAGKVEKVDKAEFQKLLGSPDSFTYPVLGALSEKAAHEINPEVFEERHATTNPNVKEEYRGIQTEAQ